MPGSARGRDPAAWKGSFEDVQCALFLGPSRSLACRDGDGSVGWVMRENMVLAQVCEIETLLNAFCKSNRVLLWMDFPCLFNTGVCGLPGSHRKPVSALWRSRHVLGCGCDWNPAQL